MWESGLCSPVEEVLKTVCRSCINWILWERVPGDDYTIREERLAYLAVVNQLLHELSVVSSTSQSVRRIGLPNWKTLFNEEIDFVDARCALIFPKLSGKWEIIWEIIKNFPNGKFSELKRNQKKYFPSFWFVGFYWN